jgi:hypothetical protein
MTTHGLLFSAPMALANVKGTKGQTRRLFPEQPPPQWGGTSEIAAMLKTCKWQVGDTIYQKETFFDSQEWKEAPLFANGPRFIYRADPDSFIGEHHWIPSIFQPREASRFTATITEVRVQRLDQISEQDAIAEGLISTNGVTWEGFDHEPGNPSCMNGYFNARDTYRSLWNSIHLAPSPIYGPKDPTTKRRPIIAYVSYPWSMADLINRYDLSIDGPAFYRNKPLHIHPNPWLFAISYKKI